MTLTELVSYGLATSFLVGASSMLFLLSWLRERGWY